MKIYIDVTWIDIFGLDHEFSERMFREYWRTHENIAANFSAVFISLSLRIKSL